MAAGIWSELAECRSAIAICTFITLAAFQFGYDSSYYSGILAMQPFLKIYGSYNPTKKLYFMSAADQSLTSSIINAGEFVGAVTSYYLIDKFGRRGSLFVSSGTVVVGTIIQVASTHIASLIVGRLVLGYAVGLISCVVPTYVADCAPARFRGALVSMYQYCIGLGLLLGVIVDYCTKDRTDTGSFRIPIAVQFAFPVVLVPGLLFWIPESPRWLVSKGRSQEARTALIRLHGGRQERVDLEMLDLEQTTLESDRGKRSSWIDLFKWSPEGRKAWLGFSLQALQQATGINFVTGYGIVFFFAVGIENPFLIQLGLYLVAMPAVWISQYSIERYGRRPILLASGLLTAAVLIIMGACGLVTHKAKSLEQVIVAMVYLFLIVFNLGWGPTVWVVTSEISTGINRGKLMSLSTGSNWFFNWLVSFTFPYLFNADGANLGARIGFLYGCLTIFAVVWVYFFLPETSGRSLEEIEFMFQEHVPVKQFKRKSLKRLVDDINHTYAKTFQPTLFLFLHRRWYWKMARLQTLHKLRSCLSPTVMYVTSGATSLPGLRAFTIQCDGCIWSAQVSESDIATLVAYTEYEKFFSSDQVGQNDNLDLTCATIRRLERCNK